jgi:hypothetical protein
MMNLKCPSIEDVTLSHGKYMRNRIVVPSGSLISVRIRAHVFGSMSYTGRAVLSSGWPSWEVAIMGPMQEVKYRHDRSAIDIQGVLLLCSVHRYLQGLLPD